LELNKCHFLAGDVLKLLDNEFELEHGHADLVVLDPPRTGLHPELIPQLIKFAPNKIVYVSCNPATAARDFQLLSSHYTITKVRPVDMFPMTNHIEMVAQLIRK
jgi:23S rRNA (uracil1939-C5)-methyltransferase